MKKYWTIFKLELQKDMQYRFNFFSRIISNALMLVFLFFFWIRIYSEGNHIGGYNLKDILTYYFIATIFTFWLSRDLGWIISDEIREGDVKNFLLKPVSYILNHFSQYIAVLFTHFIHYGPIIFIACFLLRKYFIYPSNSIQWVFFILSFFLSAALYFLVYYIMGLTSFWLGMIQGLNYGFQVLVGFMEGKYLPLDLLPTWFIKLNSFLPFKYMLYEPLSIFLNKTSFNRQSLLVPLAWTIALFVLAKVLWKRGIKVYEAYGA
ncbi:MAG: ABC-2 family transporter protein [bacterium]